MGNGSQIASAVGTVIEQRHMASGKWQKAKVQSNVEFSLQDSTACLLSSL